ncbi:MAG: MBL fold metallo-hydrolase [Oscillospiraceae bacterium]|nr:MBL fold metallo-hydrolase [Oscillospiraceae bacterium]
MEGYISAKEAMGKWRINIMRLTNNVEMLEIKGERGYLYPVLTWGDNELVLIDTALPGQTDALREAVKEAGHSFDGITKVILTHQDLDHIGSAKTLSDMGAKILAHELEAPYIQGEKTSIRLSDMESRLDKLDEGERAFYERVKKGAPDFFVHVDKSLKDGEKLDICGGIRIIHTPGHMPGHISLFLEESGIIIAGDSANIGNNKLIGADPHFTKDMGKADASFQKMMATGPTAFVCYHGGYIKV